MTTKNGCLSFKDKHQTFVDKNIGAENNSRYTNFNLNQGHHCPTNLHSETIENDSKNKGYEKSYFDGNNHGTNNSWNKSAKNLKKNDPFKAFNAGYEENDRNQWKKDASKSDVGSANNRSSSTLSLHIAAYENAIEAAAKISSPQNDISISSQGSSNSAKTWKNIHQTLSPSTLQDEFEFPRQGGGRTRTIKPEVMEFKASQKLLNPNEAKPKPAGTMILRDRKPISSSQTSTSKAPTTSQKVVANKSAAPPRDRPSMVGLPPTATIRKDVAAVKSPGRRGRKPKTPQQQSKQGESESEMDLTVDESNPATPSQNESVQEDEDGNPTPSKKRRGRPPEATSVRAKKEKEKQRREKDKERREKKKKVPKSEQQDSAAVTAAEEEETTEQDQEMEITEEAETETESDDRGKNSTAAEPAKNVMPDIYLRGYSSFQLFCDYVLRKLMIKDPDEYFAYPVSSVLAPDYHQIITTPMNFLTIRQKIDANEYTKLEEVKSDVQLICENAMVYNNPHTIYYAAAQKLQTVTRYYFSEDYLEYLRYTLPFGKDLERPILGLPERDLPQRTQRVPTEPRPAFQKQQMESITAKKLLADAPAALKKKLTTEVPKWPLGYIDNHEGAVALNLVTSTEAGKIPLGDLIGKIEAGHTGLLTNFEDAFPALTPSSYLNYEPFASFAPMYDTTWATMNQRDSELLTQTYGDRENAADIFQLRQMVVDSGGFFLEMFDNILNRLTDGEHSRTIESLEISEKEALEEMEKNCAQPPSPATFKKLLDDIGTLENIGVDTSFVEEIKAEYGLSAEPTVYIEEEEIERNGYMIADLAYLQNQRLTRNVTNLADIPQVSDAEIELSSRIATNFQQQIIEFNVGPNEIINSHAIHNAIGVNDDDGCDYDILREFMDF